MNYNYQIHTRFSDEEIFNIYFYKSECDLCIFAICFYSIFN